jgi:hypothetical protein
MRSRIDPPRMSDIQLWSRVWTLTFRARPLQNQGPKDLDLTLHQLEAVLKELQLRGKQLELVPSHGTASS